MIHTLILLSLLLLSSSLLMTRSLASEIRIEKGVSTQVGSITITLLEITLDKSYAKDLKKSTAELTVELDGETIQLTIGGFSEEAKVAHGYFIRLITASINSTTVQVTPFSMVLDAREFGLPIDQTIKLNQPITIKDIDVTVTGFAHVDAYGKYFSAELTIVDNNQPIKRHQIDPFTYLDYHFSFSDLSFTNAKLNVRPLRIGDKFMVREGQQVLVKDEDLKIKLVKEVDDSRGKLIYTFNLAKGTESHDDEIVLRYTQVHPEHIPEGKHIELELAIDLANSKTEIRWQNYVLKKVTSYNLNRGSKNAFVVLKE